MSFFLNTFTEELDYYWGTAELDPVYLRLDCSNCPLTGDLTLDDGTGASPSIIFINQNDLSASINISATNKLTITPATGNGTVHITDATTISALYVDGYTNPCTATGEVNTDGFVKAWRSTSKSITSNESSVLFSFLEVSADTVVGYYDRFTYDVVGNYSAVAEGGTTYSGTTEENKALSHNEIAVYGISGYNLGGISVSMSQGSGSGDVWNGGFRLDSIGVKGVANTNLTISSDYTSAMIEIMGGYFLAGDATSISINDSPSISLTTYGIWVGAKAEDLGAPYTETVRGAYIAAQSDVAGGYGAEIIGPSGSEGTSTWGSLLLTGSVHFSSGDYDIGTSGTSLRTLYTGSAVFGGTAATIYVDSGTWIAITADALNMRGIYIPINDDASGYFYGLSDVNNPHYFGTAANCLINPDGSITTSAVVSCSSVQVTQYIGIAADTDIISLTSGTCTINNTLKTDHIAENTSAHKINLDDNVVIGLGENATNYTLTFDGKTNDIVITWYETLNYLNFSSNLFMQSASVIYFRTTGVYVWSNDDGHLDLAASVSYDFNTADNTDLVINLVGTSNSGLLTWMEDEDYLKFSDDTLVVLDEKIYFGDTNVAVYSNDDGYLDLEADTGIRVNNFIRHTSSNYRRYYHIPTTAINPGATGATWVPPDANTEGGWQINAAGELLYHDADVHADWDGASDLSVEVYFDVNVDNTGGLDTDTVDLKLVSYYKGNGDTACKTQTQEIATVIGKSARYKKFKVTFTINYDELGNVVEAGDKFGFILNIETDTSEVDDVIMTSFTFYYNTKHLGIESGDV